MSHDQKPSAHDTSDREIVITRLFSAEREVVWNAWTDSKQIVRWWGPNGFTTKIEEMDVRPGGVWRHVMRSPDGTEFPNVCVFLEVVKPDYLIYSHGGGRKGDPAAQFEATWTFAAEGTATRVTNRMLFKSAQERDKVAKAYGAVEGGTQTLARLAMHLAAMA
jgi:uncharacterized protein YndB with AHSA1/START domain